MSSAALKRVIREFVATVWVGRDLGALAAFWTDDCINHAMPGPENRGLAALRAYHEGFLAAFAAFSDTTIEVMQQIAEDDRVVSQFVTQGTHVGPFSGIPPTGRRVTLATIRIDRMRDGKIAEHWSVADLAGLLQQLQG